MADKIETDIEDDLHGDKAKPGGKPPAGKKKNHSQMVIIAVSIIGVVLTYLIYKRSTATDASAVTDTTPGASGDVLSGGPATGTTTTDDTSGLDSEFAQLVAAFQSQQTADSQTQQGFSTMLTNLQGEIDQMSAGQTAPASSATIPTSDSSHSLVDQINAAYPAGQTSQVSTTLANENDVATGAISTGVDTGHVNNDGTLTYSYSGNDGKVYTENEPSYNQAALQKQGITFS